MPDAVEEVDDRRAALSAAWEAADKSSEVASSEAAPAEPTAEAAPEGEPAPIVESAPKARDEKGRFVPGAASKGNEAPRASATGAQEGVATPREAAIIGTPSAAPPPAPVSAKPPQSWTPENRELASRLPAEFAPLLEESNRRERETYAAIQKAAETIRTAEPLLRAVQPYMQAIQQRGMSVDQIVGNFLRTEQALSNPDEKSRASILAQAMSTYRVSVEALAGALDAAPQAVDPQAMADKVWAQIQQRQQQEEQRKTHAAIDAAVETFSANNEFVTGEGGVEGVMTALLEQGIAKDLKDAYDRACWADPRIRGIFQQREASKQAATKAQATQRAHAASSSVKSTPGGAPAKSTPPDDSWRSHLEAAWEKASQG